MQLERSKIVLLGLMGLSLAGQSPIPEAQYVELPLTYVHIPKGFDSNDHAQVVVRGSLPNLCYQGPKVTARHRFPDRVYIRATVQRPDPNQNCAQVEVPFVEVVSLGTMSPGPYGVVLNPGTKAELTASLQIEVATHAARDNHIYARVDTIEKRVADGEIILRGYNPSDCFEYDRTEFVPNSVKPPASLTDGAGTMHAQRVMEDLTDTYAVLPILKQVSEFCPRKMVKFEIRAKVPSEYRRHPLMKDRSVLLHIRVMDGRSLNTIFGEEEF